MFDNHAAIVWNIYPNKTGFRLVTPLVIDYSRERAMLKLPGGRAHERETAQQTAVRENFEEVGIAIPSITIDSREVSEIARPKWELEYPRTFESGKKIYDNPSRNHEFYAFYYIFDEYQSTRERGAEGGEFVEVHTLNDILNPYHPLQNRILKTHLLIMVDNFVFKVADELKKRFPPEFFTV
jgi:8-oxo-dGTP pyrophosphatase MutT (NUDIX family)